MLKTNKCWVVVLSDLVPDKRVYLGELDPGIRQGVYKLENACRFTERGAKRVAASYGIDATIMKV